ncbi:organomercurial lyase [Pontibacter sp. E15-1]|uniref:organomercurial lyase n=1 Tax=Pontibacter sp. E15-1 TaxID=2919918 RepID=UPI001F50191F|nr:organomercurial lyase [Pontibacter sp. E15-1]MCJ8166030.1 organomercurial lyase [Pontibacter sp. E15-1]
MKESCSPLIKRFELQISEAGQRGSEAVYAHLMNGEPLPVDRFAELLHMDAAEAQEALASYGEVDAQGRVVGFLGLSLVPTQHKLIVQNRTLYTWCAADAILLPQFLSFSALIESKDPVNGELIKLSVNEDFLEWTDPVPLSVSWVEDADSCHISDSFCQRSHFFANQETAAKWLSENPDAKISHVEDFYTFVRGGRGCC